MPVRMRIDDLRACLSALLARLDFPAHDAATIADLLVDSELRGYDDHGAYLIGHIVGWVRSGQVDPRATVEVVSEGGNTLLLDAHRASGVVAARRAMAWCIGRARGQRGIALAGVRGSSHFVAAGPHAALAAEAGLIGFACSNAAPWVAPPGGRTRTLGTNPMAYAFPRADGSPIVLDIATSGTAATKLYQAEEEGRAVPEGFVRDADGCPTTDPSALRRGGSVASLGGELSGHKGFGLAIAVDLLAAVLTGANFARDAAGGGWGQTFWALDPATFMTAAEFLARVEEQAAQIKGGDVRAGVGELLLPGERAARRAAAARAAGAVTLVGPAWRALEKACLELDVPLPA